MLALQLSEVVMAGVPVALVSASTEQASSAKSSMSAGQVMLRAGATVSINSMNCVNSVVLPQSSLTVYSRMSVEKG